MTLTVAALVAAGAFAGGFVSGLAGFGTGLIALGFWLHVIDPAPAATLVAVCSVVSQVQTLPAVWKGIDGRRIAPMVGAGLLGVPLGTWLLARVDPDLFRPVVGGLLLAYAAFMLLSRFQPRLAWGGAAADGAVGFAGGIMGGLSGLSGPLPTVWATLRGWGKDEARAVFQVFNAVVLGAVAAWHAVSGLFTPALLLLVLVSLPGTTIGAYLGARLYRRLSDARFREVVYLLLALSGATLIWASL
ncbi:sulfite exporter TauE/SafE family protein [Enterovirga sp.]|uniref:sulfite exporter TauE/SafE family protein n=1 Tax=Enterovirga sp. TaxID=2026350 RepID=UPI0026378309|nr:sulfite exporter TauE/SafE family protein [Enterovirga sp.]MDB5591541.1 permease [Enterovirga sp.]